MGAFGIIGQALAAGLSGAGEGAVQGTQNEIKEAARIKEIQATSDAQLMKEQAMARYNVNLANEPQNQAGEFLRAAQAKAGQVMPVSSDAQPAAQVDQSAQANAPANRDDIIKRLAAAISGVESGGNSDAVSPQGASGTMQIMPATFKQYAKPGEKYENDADRTAAALRKISDDYDFYKGDVAKTAAAYIGGRGAIDKDGLIRSDVSDALGTTPSDYAGKVLGALSESAPAAGSPAPTTKQQANQPPDALEIAYKDAIAAGKPQAAAIIKQAMVDKFVPIGQSGLYNTKTGDVISPDDTKEKIADKKNSVELLKARMTADPLNLTGWRQELNGGKSGGGFDNGANVDLQGLSGKPLLDALPRAIADQVKGYAEGRLTFPTGQAMRNPRMTQIMDLVSQYDPAFDAVNYGARAATRKDFTSGKSSTSINAINTTMQHLGELMDAGNALDNSSLKAWNWAGNALNDATGDPRITRFNTARNAVIDEVEKAYRGSGGSQAGIDSWKENVSSSSSPAQIKTAGQELIKLLEGKIEALGDQYSKGMGIAKNGLELLSPNARKVYNGLMASNSTVNTGVITDAPGTAASDAGGWSNLRVH